MASSAPAVVIDNGSSSIKAGFCVDDHPGVVVPSVVGRSQKDAYVGYMPSFAISADSNEASSNEAQSNRAALNLKYPIQDGVISDWDNMQKLWEHAFGNNNLRVDPKEVPVLITESLDNPKKTKEKMAEVMFETFGVPALYIAVQPVLSLYAAGRRDGIVLESGHGVTYTVPVYAGFVLRNTVNRLDISGRHLTDSLREKLVERGIDAGTSVEDIKEKVGYVALDFEQESEMAPGEKSYTLPDGKAISIGKEAFSVPEALFQPSLLGRSSVGIHEMLYDSVWRGDDDFRAHLFYNVVLSGGTTMFPGISDRLQKEVTQLTPTTMKVKINGVPNGTHSVWQGGAVLASNPSFIHVCCSKEEYEQSGPGVVHRKFI